MDAKREDKINKYSLNKYCAVLAKEFEFANELNSTARQASAERAWSAISRGADAQLSNEGGIITLLNARSIKVHGVSYTKEQAQKQGWTLLF